MANGQGRNKSNPHRPVIRTGKGGGRTGRPAYAITPREIADIEKYAAIGLTMEEISHMLGIAPATFAKWRQRDEVISAVKRGKSQGLTLVGKSLFDKAVGGDVTAQIWFEKTRGKRTDRVEVVADDQSQAITRLIGSMTPEQLQRVAAGESPAQVLGHVA